jgi:hypothetical protein
MAGQVVRVSRLDRNLQTEKHDKAAENVSARLDYGNDPDRTETPF